MCEESHLQNRFVGMTKLRSLTRSRSVFGNSEGYLTFHLLRFRQRESHRSDEKCPHAYASR